MSEEDKRAKCPVCGRFCKQGAVDKYDSLVNEKVRIAEELDDVAVELGKARKAVVEAQETCSAEQKRAADYEAMYIDTRGKLDQTSALVGKLQDKLADAGTKLVALQSECNAIHEENERIYSRGLWARIRNRRV